MGCGASQAKEVVYKVDEAAPVPSALEAAMEEHEDALARCEKGKATAEPSEAMRKVSMRLRAVRSSFRLKCDKVEFDEASQRVVHPTFKAKVPGIKHWVAHVAKATGEVAEAAFPRSDSYVTVESEESAEMCTAAGTSFTMTSDAQSEVAVASLGATCRSPASALLSYMSESYVGSTVGSPCSLGCVSVGALQAKNGVTPLVLDLPAALMPKSVPRLRSIVATARADAAPKASPRHLAALANARLPSFTSAASSVGAGARRESLESAVSQGFSDALSPAPKPLLPQAAPQLAL